MKQLAVQSSIRKYPAYTDMDVLPTDDDPPAVNGRHRDGPTHLISAQQFVRAASQNGTIR